MRKNKENFEYKTAPKAQYVRSEYFLFKNATIRLSKSARLYLLRQFP